MHRGFSLMELLVVLAVVGVLISLAVPGLQAQVARYRVHAAAQAFVKDMRWARSEAIKRSSSVSLCMSSDGRLCGAQGWATGWLVFTDEDGNGQLGGADELLRVQASWVGLAGMGGAEPANDRRFFVFQGQGVARAATQTMRVWAQGGMHERLVCVSMQGRAALRPAGDVACD